MTERLSDERLRRISGNGTSFALPTVSEVPEMARELLDLRVAVHELRQNIGIIGAELADKGAKLAAGPVMPEAPSEDVLRFGATRPFVGGSPIECFYHGFRDALLAEQNDARAVE